MASKPCDIHSFKVNGSCATWNADSDTVHVMFANNVSRHIPFASVKAVATGTNECLVHLHDALPLGSRSNKPRDSLIATFTHPEGAPLFSSTLKNANVTNIDISDCPSLELANGAMAYMHDDGVAWKFGANCVVSLFSNVTGAVFQRIQGGASTFDILFIEDECMHTIEYVPHSVLENWVQYLPEHVRKMTSGADPVNMSFLRSKLSEPENLVDVAAAHYADFCEQQDTDDECEDEDSEYNPDEQSSTDEESDMDSECSEES